MMHTIIEILVLILTLGLAALLYVRKERRQLTRAAFVLLGVFLFEVLSQPMWRNPGWSDWTYLYGNVNWIVTLGWTLIFLVTLFVTERIASKRVRFWSRIGVLTLVTAPIEVFLYESGLRAYSAELSATFSGVLIPGTSAPIEVFLAIPLIGMLVIPFALHLEKLSSATSAKRASTPKVKKPTATTSKKPSKKR